jgi:hypothetical protein
VHRRLTTAIELNHAAEVKRAAVSFDDQLAVGLVRLEIYDHVDVQGS